MARRLSHGAQRAPRRFLRDTQGVAALEFAMLAPIFFGLLFAMFEVGITYFAGAVLQDAVNDAARQVRTGAVQGAGLTQQEFRQSVCDKIDMLMACDTRLNIDVRTAVNFAGANGEEPVNEEGEYQIAFSFNPGQACDVVLVRAFYEWETLTPVLGEFMANTSGGQHLLRGAAVVRNEPFGANNC